MTPRKFVGKASYLNVENVDKQTENNLNQSFDIYSNLNIN
jgi:hypothetical protein